MLRESVFQNNLITQIKLQFPGAYVLKNDASYIQGIPDLSVFYGKHWGMLECKRTEKSSVRPNQAYYVDLFNEMSYASFVYPQNEKEVLHELQHALRP